jgi:hypothetical protein
MHIVASSISEYLQYASYKKTRVDNRVHPHTLSVAATVEEIFILALFLVALIARIAVSEHLAVLRFCFFASQVY